MRDRDGTPTGAGAPTAAPSVGARVLAFASIVLAGSAGGFIGWALVDLQCRGDCTVAAGLAGVGGAVVAAVGVGIVAVLALRAMAEWRTVEAGNRRRERGDAVRATPRVR